MRLVIEAVEMRAGTIIDVADFPEARKPAYKITVDFDTARRLFTLVTALYRRG